MVLYGYLSSCYLCRNKERKRSQKNEEARQVVQALRLHQQQNSFEYQMKSSSQNLSKPRSNTLH